MSKKIPSLVGEDESEAVAAEEEDEDFERSMRDPGKKSCSNKLFRIVKKYLQQPSNVIFQSFTDKLLRFSINNCYQTV